MSYRPTDVIEPRIRMERVQCHCPDPACPGKEFDSQKRPRTALMLKLAGELLREYPLGVTITSCQRCPAWNQKQGGSPNSAHIHNCAIDIVTDGPVMDLVILAEQQGIWSQIHWNLLASQIHLDLHPDDRVRRGYKDATGTYRVQCIGRRADSPLKVVYAWNRDERDEDPPVYVNARYQRSTTDGI